MVVFVAGDFWVSASDVGQPAGQFVWADGRKVDDGLWFNLDPTQKQPNAFGPGKETCAIFSIKSGDLWDFPCSEHKFLVCQVPQQCL